MLRHPGSHARPRVLMLTHRVPYPLDRGDRIRAYHLLHHLSQRCDVSLACTDEQPPTLAQKQALRRLTERYAIRPIAPRLSRLRGAVAAAWGRAITPACFYRADLARTICAWQDEAPFDAVLTFCTSMLRYARKLRTHVRWTVGQEYEPRHLLDLVDVDSLKWATYAEQTRGPLGWVYGLEARRLRRLEAGARDRFDAITLVSEAEAGAYREHVGEHPGLAVLRHAVDAGYFRPLPDAGTRTLVFVGNLEYRPNVEGIAWFVEQVMPALAWSAVHEPAVGGVDGRSLRLKIVGRNPSSRVRALGSYPGVEVVGSVPDVRPYLEEAAVVIAPLRTARGVQTKVLEAMSSQRAVVCSPAAAEGILAEPGTHLLVADEAMRWVETVRRVLEDVPYRKRIAEAARQRIEAEYRWAICLAPLESLLLGAASSEQGLHRLAA